MGRVGVTKEEKNLSYYRFFEKELAAVTKEKLEILEKGVSEKKSVPFESRNLFLAGKDEEFCQVGYGVQDDGTGFVCNATYMPGVTGEMMDWWFPWHSVGSDLRYKIWDPEDHYFARADKVDYVCDPEVPMREKTWGVSHYIMEDVGPGPEYLKLNFMRPADFGYDESLIGTEKCQSMVCAIGESSCAAAMTHKWYPYKEGIMFCSRFWIGYGRVNGTIVKTLPDGVKIPEFVPEGLYAHNIKEFTNLASILKDVYHENRDNF